MLGCSRATLPSRVLRRDTTQCNLSNHAMPIAHSPPSALWCREGDKVEARAASVHEKMGRSGLCKNTARLLPAAFVSLSPVFRTDLIGPWHSVHKVLVLVLPTSTTTTCCCCCCYLRRYCYYLYLLLTTPRVYLPLPTPTNHT